MDEISYWDEWGRRFRGRRLVQFGVAAAGLAAFGCSNTGVCSGNGFSQQITGSPAAPGSGLSVATLLLGNASAFGRVIYARNLPLAHNTRQAFFGLRTGIDPSQSRIEAHKKPRFGSTSFAELIIA